MVVVLLDFSFFCCCSTMSTGIPVAIRLDYNEGSGISHDVSPFIPKWKRLSHSVPRKEDDSSDESLVPTTRRLGYDSGALEKNSTKPPIPTHANLETISLYCLFLVSFLYFWLAAYAFRQVYHMICKRNKDNTTIEKVSRQRYLATQAATAFHAIVRFFLLILAYFTDASNTCHQPWAWGVPCLAIFQGLYLLAYIWIYWTLYMANFQIILPSLPTVTLPRHFFRRPSGRCLMKASSSSSKATIQNR